MNGVPICTFLASISALLKAVRNLGLTWVKEKARVTKFPDKWLYSKRECFIIYYSLQNAHTAYPKISSDLHPKLVST